MQEQALNWIELAKTLGPYATAITAIVAVFMASWLAHKNWLKQFAVERSDILRRERTRLSEEVLLKVVKATSLASKFLELRALIFATSKLMDEKFLSNEALVMLVELNKRSHETSAQVQEMFAEVVALSVPVSIYFGNKASQAITSTMEFLGTLGNLSSPYSEGLQRIAYEAIRGAGGIDPASVGSRLHEEFGSVLKELLPRLRQIAATMLADLDLEDGRTGVVRR